MCIAVCAAVLVPTRTQATTTIHPGDAMRSSVGWCTLGFVARDAVDTFFMTAAHCVARLGANIELEDGTVFGDAVVFGNEDLRSDDWALIRVRSAFVPMVRPTVRGVGGTPTGVATPSETDLLDVLRISGHGEPFYLHPLLRENRYGVLTEHTSSVYEALAMDNFGDSGGPIVHRQSGQALGLVSRLCIGNPCTSEGPTIQGVLSKAAAKGYPVSLDTV